MDVQSYAVVDGQAHQLKTAGQGDKHQGRQTEAFHQGHVHLESPEPHLILRGEMKRREGSRGKDTVPTNWNSEQLSHFQVLNQWHRESFM